MKNIPQHILKLVQLYLSKEIEEEALNELQNWINQSPENRQLFIDCLYVYKKSRGLKFLEKMDSNMAWRRLNLKLKISKDVNEISFKKEKSVKHLKTRFNFLKYAAVAFLFLGLGYLYKNGSFQKDQEVLSPANHITLQLNDGKVKIIDETGISKVLDSKGNVVGEQNGDQLVYGEEAKAEALVYNTLTIPYGKRFEIKLSDGTQVHLNAGSSLKYPISFLKGKNRKVFLTGEAYFDVAKDSEHPFIVNADDMDVRVLGTQFNISSYPEDKSIKTVLVEGAVSIYAEKESYSPENSSKLTPGYKAEWQKNNQEVSIEKADIELATAWIDGKIIFRRTPFNDIAKKLERHYNVTIINNNEALGKQLYGASFDVETIEQVLESFNANFKIEYTIQNNQIIIN